MTAQSTPKNETADAFKARLRQTAMGIPETVIRKMLSRIKRRAQSIFEHDGGDIPRD